MPLLLQTGMQSENSWVGFALSVVSFHLSHLRPSLSLYVSTKHSFCLAFLLSEGAHICLFLHNHSLRFTNALKMQVIQQCCASVAYLYFSRFVPHIIAERICRRNTKEIRVYCCASKSRRIKS